MFKRARSGWLLAVLVGCQGDNPLQPGGGGQPLLSTPQFVRAWGGEGTAEGTFQNPQGIAIDSRDLVYVADSENNRIQKFDAAGRFLAMWGRHGVGEGEFRLPIDIAVDRSGHVYVADRNNHRIQVFDAAGRFVKTWGTPGTGDGELLAPGSIAIAGQRVFVADVSQRVQRFSLAGRFETGWSLYDGSVEEFPDVFDLEVDAKGDVWVVEHTQHRIRKFDADGRLLASWDRKGGGPGELQYPLAIALDGHGRVLVVEQEGRAQLFDASGRFLLQWRAAPPCGPYSSVLGVAVSRAGHIFAVDGAHHCVLDFAIPLEPTVQTWWSWGTWGSAEGSFYSPFGIDVAADGRVYVGDANARVQVFTATGEFLHQFGTPGMGEDELQSPRGIAVAGDRVHVADRAGDGAVVVYGLDGVFVDRWSIEPPPGPALVFPAGIAFDTSGNCYVTATPTRIDVFDTNGVRLRTWGVVGSAPGQFRRVSDVAVDGSGIVYVADTVNRWIGRFDADGTFRDLVADASGLAAGGIDVTPDGQVFASTGNGIRQYDADGRLLAAWGRAGSCEREFDGAGDLAVDAQGRVFVTDVGNHRVQVFVPPFTTSAKGELP